MIFEALIPISLFVCIAYAIKVVVDARVRHRMVAAGGSGELVDSVLRDEELRRRHSSLHWGVVLVLDGAVGQPGDPGDLRDGGLFEVVQGQQRALQGR